MNKRKPKAPGEKPGRNFNQDHPEFYEWWKEHRHSGFVEDDEGKYHWNTLPEEAWYVDRYRSEFSNEKKAKEENPF